MVEPLPDSASRRGWRHPLTGPFVVLTAQPLQNYGPASFRLDSPSRFWLKASTVLSKQRKSSTTSSTNPLDDFLSRQANVNWALSLPSKAQQIHFSCGEQASITAAALASPQPSNGALTPTYDYHIVPESSDTRSSSSMASTSPHTMEAFPSSQEEQALYHWQGQKAFLDDYHHRVAAASVAVHQKDKASESKSRSRRPSFKRTISLISDSRARSSADLPSPAASVVRPSRKSWANTRRAAARSSTDTITLQVSQAPLQYYQDPSTRLKLREYLGSPRGFDEALQHGFPSAMPTPDQDYGRASISTRATAQPRSSLASHRGGINDAQKFLRNEVLSWLDNSDDEEEEDVDEATEENRDDISERKVVFVPTEESDDAEGFDIDNYLEHDQDDGSSPELASPITPHTADFIPLSRPKSARYTPHPLPAASMPISPRSPPPIQGDWPLVNRVHDYPGAYSTPVSPSTPAWPAAREMTIRMTLTRPELRASDEQIYGNHGQARVLRKAGTDPMELPPLQQLSLQEVAPRSKSGNTKRRSLWRKMSKGGLK